MACMDNGASSVERALISLGRDELRSLLEEQGGCELTCQFCDRIHRFSRKELENLLQKIEEKKI